MKPNHREAFVALALLGLVACTSVMLGHFALAMLRAAY